jgi:hypothetical protein
MFLRRFGFLMMALSALVHAEEAKDTLLNRETLGKLRLGMPATAVIAACGKPESKGEQELWGATGEYVQEWRYPKQGLKIQLASGNAKGPFRVFTITIEAPSTFKTARGIGIGSPEADVTKAYANEKDADSTKPGDSFVAGSIYGGVIFGIEDGKVVEIFLGAAAE